MMSFSLPRESMGKYIISTCIFHHSPSCCLFSQPKCQKGQLNQLSIASPCLDGFYRTVSLFHHHLVLGIFVLGLVFRKSHGLWNFWSALSYIFLILSKSSKSHKQDIASYMKDYEVRITKDTKRANFHTNCCPSWSCPTCRWQFAPSETTKK